MNPPTTIVERTAETIAFRIVSGQYAAGDLLPSVRKLAGEFGINPSTVQVVLARLQSVGFVQPHQGLGFVVKDVEQMGGIPIWRYIFRFAQQLPERAEKIYADLLDMRLVLIGEAVKKIAADPGRYDPAPVRRAVEKIEMLVRTAPEDMRGIARAELHATRMLILAVGQSVVTAVLNSIGEVYLDVPAVVAAMYFDPPMHLAIWNGLLIQWERGRFSAKTTSQFYDLFREYDKGILKRFRKIVSAPDYKVELPSVAEIRRG